MLLKGGPRTQVFQTKRSLENLGVEVGLFESFQEFIPGAVDLVHVFGANVGTFHLVREFGRIGVPLVVTPIFFTRRSAPFVRTIVAADSAVRRFARGAWTDYGFAARICSWAGAVLPNTRREAHLIEKGLGIPRGNITVVPNGVEERFRGADPGMFRERYGPGEFVLNVGHVGPPRKNVLNLLRALEKIQCRAVIIGRIEDNDYARSCREVAGSNPRLLMLDSLPNNSELLASAYAACDVFALPSQFETPGIAALEAGLAGAKVVVTKYGGTEEYFGPLAEYVEPTSPELIRHGIVAALNRKKTPELREHIGRNFTWDAVARKTLAVYESLLRQPGSRSSAGRREEAVAPLGPDA